MLIYNVTIKLDWSIQEAWISWMKEIHMPEVMATGCFYECRLLRLLDTDETEGPTYAAQYQAATKEEYNRYLETFAPGLREAGTRKWGSRFMAFRSVMELV